MRSYTQLGLRVARNERDPASLKAAKRGYDLLGAERVRASERLVLAQPAELAENGPAIPMSSLVALDRRKLSPRTAGERSDDVPGLQAVIAGDWLFDRAHRHFSVRGDPAGTADGGGIGEAAGIGDAAGIDGGGGIGVSFLATHDTLAANHEILF